LADQSKEKDLVEKDIEKREEEIRSFDFQLRDNQEKFERV
jgi:hypothetical protein